MSPNQPLTFSVTVAQDDLVAWGVWSRRHCQSRATRWTSGYVVPLYLLALTLLPPYTLAKFLVLLACSSVIGLSYAWLNR